MAGLQEVAAYAPFYVFENTNFSGLDAIFFLTMVSILYAYIFAVHIYIHVLEWSLVANRSMLPNLHPGDRVLIDKIGYGLIVTPGYYQSKDLKRYKFPFSRKITPGDIVTFFSPQNNDIYIKRVREIRDSGVYVEGDNPKRSVDSKDFGPIAVSDIIGRVIYIQRKSHEKP